jgi:predicted ATPase/DNA-binding SARP family transcriptional activator
MVGGEGGAVLHVYLLGNPKVQLEGKSIHLETTKTLALLVYLIMRPGSHRRDMLAGLLWGEQDDGRAARSLRRALWNLRRVLCPQDSEECPYFIVTRQEVAFERRSSYWLDVEQFARMTALPQELSSEAQLECLRKVVQLYRGDFVEGLYPKDALAFEEWALGERARLREMALQALQRLSDLHTAQGEYDEAITTLRRLLALAPWLENGHRRLMLCHALTGQRSAALAQYERCRRTLQEELGTEPLPETTALYHRVLNQEITEVVSDPMTRQRGFPIPFTGRGREHAWLLEQWEAARRGGGGLTLIEGEAGVGKTRLVEEVLRFVSGRGAVVMAGRCYEFSGSVPYQPIAAALRAQIPALGSQIADLGDVWLAELSRLLPELRDIRPELPGPVRISEKAARQRLFEAIARFLLEFGQQSWVLFLDDLHWADPDTLSLLHHLVRALQGAAGWLIGAYRPEETPLNHPLTRLRQSLNRDHLLYPLSLEVLTAKAVAQIAARLVREKDSDILATYLFRESEGNPFILGEVLGELEGEGILRARGDTWRLTGDPRQTHILPERVQDVILQRTGRLSEEAQWRLSVAAVIGQPFTPELLASAAGEPVAALVGTLEVSQARHLLQPDAAGRYDFVHDRIRATIYHHLSPQMCKLLHERVGQALLGGAGRAEGLEPWSTDTSEGIAVQVAYHFERCLDPRRAAPYLAQAAEAARQVYAHEAAIDYYQRLLPLLEGREQVEVMTKLACAWRLTGQWAKSKTLCRRAIKIAEQARAYREQARAWHQLARVQEAEGDYHAVLASAARVEATARMAGEEARKELAAALLRKGWASYRLGDMPEALFWGERALAINEEIGDCVWASDSLNLIGAIYNQLGRYEQAIPYMERALTLFREMGDKNGEALMLNNLGYTAYLQGDYEAAISHYQQALCMAQEIGDYYTEILCLNNLGGARAAVGEYLAAEGDLCQVLDMAEASQWFLLTETYRYLAEAYLGQGRIDEALVAARRALALARETEAQQYAGAAWRVLGKIATQLPGSVSIGDDAYDASMCFASSVQIFTEAGMDAERARALWAWAQYEMGRDRALGEEMRHEAKVLFERLRLVNW